MVCYTAHRRQGDVFGSYKVVCSTPSSIPTFPQRAQRNEERHEEAGSKERFIQLRTFKPSRRGLPRLAIKPRFALVFRLTAGFAERGAARAGNISITVSCS